MIAKFPAGEATRDYKRTMFYERALRLCFMFLSFMAPNLHALAWLPAEDAPAFTVSNRLLHQGISRSQLVITHFSLVNLDLRCALHVTLASLIRFQISPSSATSCILRRGTCEMWTIVPEAVLDYDSFAVRLPAAPFPALLFSSQRRGLPSLPAVFARWRQSPENPFCLIPYSTHK